MFLLKFVRRALVGGIIVIIIWLFWLSLSTARAEDNSPVFPFPALGGLTDASRTEPLFSLIATSLAKRPATVRCWSKPDWAWLDQYNVSVNPPHSLKRVAGFVSFNYPDRMELAPSTCHILSVFAYGPDHALPKSGEAQAELAARMETLAHESQHIKGIGNEAQAHCYGMQLIRWVAMALGASRRDANTLTRVYWERRYWLKSRQYTSNKCYPKHEFDLSPSTRVWP